MVAPVVGPLRLWQDAGVIRSILSTRVRFFDVLQRRRFVKIFNNLLAAKIDNGGLSKGLDRLLRFRGLHCRRRHFGVEVIDKKRIVLGACQRIGNGRGGLGGRPTSLKSAINDG